MVTPQNSGNIILITSVITCHDCHIVMYVDFAIGFVISKFTSSQCCLFAWEWDVGVDNMDLSRSVSVRLYAITELHENRSFGVTFRGCLQAGTRKFNGSSK
jgi:hypothetical protein